MYIQKMDGKLNITISIKTRICFQYSDSFIYGFTFNCLKLQVSNPWENFAAIFLFFNNRIREDIFLTNSENSFSLNTIMTLLCIKRTLNNPANRVNLSSILLALNLIFFIYSFYYSLLEATLKYLYLNFTGVVVVSRPDKNLYSFDCVSAMWSSGQRLGLSNRGTEFEFHLHVNNLEKDMNQSLLSPSLGKQQHRLNPIASTRYHSKRSKNS